MTTDTDDAAMTLHLWPTLVTVVALGSLPYVSLLAANVGEGLALDRVLAWWAVTVVLGLMVVALVVVRLGRRAARWVGALVGVALYLFFNFPAITGLRDAVGVPMGDVAWWALVSVMVIAVMVPVARTSAGQQFLAIVAPALLLLPLAQLTTASLAAAEPAPAPSAESAIALQHTPNVYWFVLDGQAGPPFLRDEIGMDPDPFLDHLRGRGFDVQGNARSNYPFTHLAVGSALDMEYIYDGVEEPADASPYFERLQGHNRTVDTFLAHGYGYVHAYPGLWSGSRCSGREDVCIGDHGPLDDTEWALASATPLIEVLADRGASESIATVNDPLHVTEVVLSSAPDPPRFAFVHLLNPHPPYLRDADCRLREVPLRFADWGEGAGYGDAVACLFDRLETSVDRILDADDDPVIIIQGDHGPRLGLDRSTSGAVLLDDPMYFSTLSAIRLPRRCDDLDVPDDLTLVNTFRIVFACLQDEPPALLPDRIFPILREY